MTKGIIAQWIADYENLSTYNWVIELKESQKIIGNISVVEVKELVMSASIGYCMGKDWWGQAIMPEALGCILSFLFQEVRFHRICACHDANNSKSGRVMEKVGMKFEGVLRAAGYTNHLGIHDVVWRSILSEEYGMK